QHRELSAVKVIFIIGITARYNPVKITHSPLLRKRIRIVGLQWYVVNRSVVLLFKRGVSHPLTLIHFYFVSAVFFGGSFEISIVKFGIVEINFCTRNGVAV